MANITGGVGKQTFVFDVRGPSSDTITDFRSTYFSASLDESQEVPPTGSDATGEAVLALNFARSRLEVNAEFDGVQLDEAGGFHFHRAPAGDNGSVVWGFFGPDSDTNDDTVIDPVANTIFSAWDADEGNGTTLADELPFLLDDGLYLNIHTEDFPGGLIRGQVLREDGGNDQIDVRALNIGSFGTLQEILRENGDGDAVLRTFFNGRAFSLTLDGVSPDDLRASFFRFAGNVDQTVTGKALKDDLFGAGGEDTVNGGGGNDRLFGETGDDDLRGGQGRDTLNGGAGADELNGGLSGDTFDFNAPQDSRTRAMDTIADFDAGEGDRIDLRTIDANTISGGNGKFDFVGSDPFSETAGELRFAGRSLSGDTDGDGRADFRIVLAGVRALAEDDILL